MTICNKMINLYSSVSKAGAASKNTQTLTRFFFASNKLVSLSNQYWNIDTSQQIQVGFVVTMVIINL